MKFESAEKGYANLWARMVVTKPDVAKALAAQIAENKRRYEIVAAEIGCPWWFIGIVHHLEGSGRFTTHLHNGDPLTAKTVHVPAGRPLIGKPPFTWEASAKDALIYQGIDQIKQWSIPRALFEFERYNGFGYVSKGINSPYVWSFSNLYSRGKFVADGRFDANAISQQCGAAPLLWALGLTEEKGMSDLNNLLQQFRQIAPTIATGVGGPLAGIIVKAVADQFQAPHDEPEKVVEKINTTPIQDVIRKLTAAESAVQQITPAEPIAQAPAPVPVAPVTPPADPVLPLQGYKTYLGIAIYVAAYVAGALHYATPEVVGAIQAVGIGLGGVGIIDKITRWLPFLAAPKVAVSRS